MNFDFQLDLENLAKHSDDIIRNLCHSETKAFKEFKTKITAMLSDTFLQDSDLTKLSLLNRFETEYPCNKRIKCGHQDIASSEMLIEEGNICDGRKSDPFHENEFKMTESGFFEASGSSSSEEKVTTSSDERLQDGVLPNRNQKMSVASDKKKDFGAPSSKIDDGCKLVWNSVTAETDFKISIQKKSFEDTNDKTKALLNTTYIIEEHGVSTPKDMLDIRLIQSKHLKNKFLYLQSIKRKKQMERSSETLLQIQGKRYLQSIERKKQMDGNMKLKQQQQQKRRVQLMKMKKYTKPNSKTLIQQGTRHHDFKTNVSRKINSQLRSAINQFCPKLQPLRNEFQANRHFRHGTEASNETKQLGLKMCGNNVRNDAKKKIPQLKEIPKIKIDAGKKKMKECPLAFKRIVTQRKCNVNPTNYTNKILTEPEAKSNIKSLCNLGTQTNKLNKWACRKNSNKCWNEICSKKISAVKRDNLICKYCSTTKCFHKSDFNEEKSNVPVKGNSTKRSTPMNSWATYHDSLLEDEVAAWAKGVSLKEALLRQHHCSSEFNPDHFFGSFSRSVRLEDIFGSSAYNHTRTSSANWSS